MQFIIMLGHTYCLEKKNRDHQAGRGKYLKERVIEIHTLIVGCIWLEIWPEYPDIRVVKVTSEDNNTATSLRQEMKQL
jgi:hypothetical protein